MSFVPVTSASVTAGLLRLEPIVYVLMRIGARSWLILSPLGWADTPVLRALAVAFMGYDLGLAIWLRRSMGPSLPVRWVLNTADVTVWALLCPATEPYTAAVVVAVPFLIMTTVRNGFTTGAVAGAGITAVTSIGRLAIGAQPFTTDTLINASLAVVLGAILARLLRGEVNRQRQLSSTLEEADFVAAAFAGRNDVVTGVDAEAIDDLQTSIMRLTAAGADAAAMLRAAVGAHKLSLGEETRARAVYLRDALDTYAAAVRAHEPAVARHVFFEVPGEDGACVLSRRQAGQLTDALSAAGFTGFIPVRVLEYSLHGTIVIQVGPSRFTLAPTAPARIHLALAPVATAGLALYILTLSNGNYTAVPLRLTVPLAAAVLGYAGVGLALIRRYGQGAEPWVAIGALGPFALVAFLTAHAARHTGVPRLTLLGPLAGLALLLGTVVHPRTAVVAAWCGLGLAGAAAVLSSPGLVGRYVAAELIWPLIAFFGAHLTARAVGRLSQDLSTRLSEERRAKAERTRRQAALREVRYLLSVLDQGEQLCVTAQPGPVRNQVAGELLRLRERLDSMATTFGYNDDS